MSRGGGSVLPYAVALVAAVTVACLALAWTRPPLSPRSTTNPGSGAVGESFENAFELMFESNEGHVREVELTVTRPGGRSEVYVSTDIPKIQAFLIRATGGRASLGRLSDASVRVTFDRPPRAVVPRGFSTQSDFALNPRYGFRRVK